ncbi:xanthine phosphoribosyltransferase [Fusibacter sp. JL216-2]|uniref:xanthine phosphoribosyltransferase n=1 Tax=Fusibacter sp. JL216-2 TaxID=3071453 RepID=UPI003D335651
MEALKNAILEKGQVVGEDILKVDTFLNHQLDASLLNEIGKEFKRRFEGQDITKILTIEASGIAIAIIAAQYFNVPVVFAKKVASKNLDDSTYETDVFSFTKAKNYKVRVSKKFISATDKVLVLDDFLARGRAALGLRDIVHQAGAELAGVGIVIEKGFQEGGQVLRGQGIRVDSLAVIDSFKDGAPVFREV